MSTDADKRIFTKEWSEDQQCWFLVLNPSISAAQRRELTRYVATVLREPRLLTFAELESCLYFEPEPNMVYWWRLAEGRRHRALVVFTDEWLHEHDLLEEFDHLQELLLATTYQKALVKMHEKGKKTYYQYGVSFQPTGGPQSAQLTVSARNEDKIDGADINYKLLDFSNKVAFHGVPELASNARRHDNLKHASLIPGPKGSSIFTNQQQNFAAIGADLSNEIGKFGSPHEDSNDDLTSMTFMPDMSLLPTTTHNGQEVRQLHGGRFCIPALKAAIPMRPRSVVGFSATFLHFALSILRCSVPEDSPLRLPPSSPYLPPPRVQADGTKYKFLRLTIPVYTEIKMKYPTFGQFSPEIFTRKAGLALFTQPHGHQDWMANFFIRFEEIVGRYVVINYNDHPDNLFAMGPKILIAALTAYMAKWCQESVDHKRRGVKRDGKAKKIHGKGAPRDTGKRAKTSSNCN